ncbi:hypothetical protein BKA66DRAFT_6177 [Pyrenochaeta sp. MPI-SDFR-AT-0127]|nr:hypothetical protein BKA66DRAFT_6177 [Pyrenochaeta sp. MPI-SDFR-AT-0127]
MHSKLPTVVLAALALQVISSPLDVQPSLTPTSTLPTTCTLNVFRTPTFETYCTLYTKTRTSTSYTDCHGCEIKTKVLGLGLPCQTLTTAFGVAIETIIACKEKDKYMTTAATTASEYQKGMCQL